MTHTVLLVDDDADVLHCLARMLQKQPYQLYTARSGEEAVNLLKSRRVDVIVADQCMPGMSGTDLLAWAANHYPDIVPIMLTGHATTETLVRAINEGGVYQVVTKPCNEAHLAILIRKALEHKDLLEKHAHFLETNQQQAKQQQRVAKDMQVLNHLLSRDLDKPLHSVAQSCQSLLEQHCEVFDPKARSLLDDTLEAISDIQRLIEDLQTRTGAWESKDSDSCAEPQAALTGNREDGTW